MDIREIWAMFKWWVWLIIAVLLLGTGWWVVDKVFFAPGRAESARVEARADAIVERGKANAQKDATEVITQNTATEAVRAAEGKKSDERVRQACNGTAAECGNAGLRELCNGPGGKNQPRCVKLFGTRP